MQSIGDLVNQQVPLWALPVAALVKPLIWDKIRKGTKNIPSFVFERIGILWRAKIAKGDIDEPTQRLVRYISRGLFTWADEEMPNMPGPAKMNAVLSSLACVPYLGWVVRGSEARWRDLLEALYQGFKEEEAKAKVNNP